MSQGTDPAGGPPPSSTAPDPLELSSGRGRWVVAATVLGSGIAFLDSTVVGIALPSIGREFHGGVGTLQWVVTGYSLTLAAFLLLGGSLGDRYGRKRIFTVGVAWFAVASACCGLAPSAALLVAARVVQGVGGALMTPASLAILQASFRPEDRARAIGAWSGLSGLAAAAGPLVGGYLLAIGSWRWVFYINLPLAAAVLVITARHVPESRDPTSAGRVDVVGAGLAVVFLAGLTYGLIEAPTRGWSSPAVVVSLVLAAVTAPAFLVVEHRRAHPMLPLELFRSRQFSGANAVTFAVYGALGGALFLLPVELQIVKGYSPLASGLALLPVTLVMLALSARSGALSARIGPRLQMTVGPLIVAAGLALLRAPPTPGPIGPRCSPPCCSSPSASPSPSRRSRPPPWAPRRPSTPASRPPSTTWCPAPPVCSPSPSCRSSPASPVPPPSAPRSWPRAFAPPCSSPPHSVPPAGSWPP